MCAKATKTQKKYNNNNRALALDKQVKSGLGEITDFSCSDQLSMKFTMFINYKMPLIVGITIFISRIITTYESNEAINVLHSRCFSLYEPLKCHAQFS